MLAFAEQGERRGYVPEVVEADRREGLTRQRQHLLMFREAVGRSAAGAPSLSEAQERELTQITTRFLPEAPLNWLVGLGADAVAAELAA
jgi:hypothetical protein